MINQQIQGKVTGQHAWVIQLMSEPKFSPRLKEISPTTMARVTLSKHGTCLVCTCCIIDEIYSGRENI